MASAHKNAAGTMAASIGVSRPTKTLHSTLLSGSIVLLGSSSLVGVTNLLYNVATARLLGPTGFANATAVYTLLMLMSAITLTYQVVVAKYVARNTTGEEKSAVFVSLHRKAWLTAASIGLTLLLFRSAIASYLNLPHAALISELALGTLFYIPLGVRRGYIQGTHAFGRLAINFMLEGVVRLGGAVVLIGAGLGVQGAVLASVAAVIVSYFAATLGPDWTPHASQKIHIPFMEGLQAIVFFAGQVVINNFDILLVKHFFASEQAGVYAAVSLVGRVVNMCAWSVVNTMFPVSASARENDREAKPVLLTSLSMVLLILVVFILALSAVPSFLWRMIFGAHLGQSSYGGLTSLLILYAVTTGIYCLSSVIITYEMSRKIANTSWVQLAFSGSLILGICVLHHTLRQVIAVQLVLVLIMLVLVALPLLRREVASTKVLEQYPRLQLLRSLSEHEVIASFLRSEFHHPEFHEYQEFRYLVNKPDFESPRENALRRALLFLRRGAMWRELPENTRWFQATLTHEDLARIRFFPRAQWRRVAQGSFYLTDMIESLRTKLQEPSDDEFFRKLERMSDSVQQNLENPTILLIGVDSQSPLTILDGNHRMAAAMLAVPPAAIDSFHFICGLSPDMTRCCWYRTNVNTLWRYLTNLLRHYFYNPESDIGRFQQKSL
jgi:O-antigen/teichoic acid export membrane protein